MTRLSEVAATSRRVAETSSRNAKIAVIAQTLRRLAPDEIAIAVAWLSGETRQGRSGIGYALLTDASRSRPAATASLSIDEVDSALDAIAAVSGAGSKARRTTMLADLLTRATAEERDFLLRLLTG